MTTPPPDLSHYPGYGFPLGRVTVTASVAVGEQTASVSYSVPSELWADDPVMQEAVKAHVMRLLATELLQHFEVTMVATVEDAW